MKLGELMVGGGVISTADLERGLARQRVSRARLGSTLVEMRAVTTDEVARALARQHGVPAALDRHLSGRDPGLVARLSHEVARELCAVPIAMSRGGDGLNLVVCMRDPSPAAIAKLRAAVGMPIIPSVASELALRRELDLAYPEGAGDDGSFDIDVDEPSQPQPVPRSVARESSQPFANLGESSLVGLDDMGVFKDHSQNLSSTGGMPAITGLAAAPTGSRQSGAMPSIAAVPVAAPPAPIPTVAPPPPPPPPPILTLDDAVTAIAHATTADRVSALAIDYLRGGWKAGLVMAVKEKMALGQCGFGGAVTDASVESIVVPLDQPSVLRTAHDDRRPFVGEAPIGSLAQDRFMRLFIELHTRTIAVSPVLVRDRAVCLVFALGPTAKVTQAGAAVAVLAHAMGEAYLRIILASKRH